MILIVIFGFLVARNFWKLVGERRRGILGSHLNLKFVAAFVLIALVTTSGLFIVSAFFITNSIDKWFSVQVDRALEQSGEVADLYYESTARRALGYGGLVARQGPPCRLAHCDELLRITPCHGRRGAATPLRHGAGLPRRPTVYSTDDVAVRASRAGSLTRGRRTTRGTRGGGAWEIVDGRNCLPGGTLEVRSRASCHSRLKHHAPPLYLGHSAGSRRPSYVLYLGQSRDDGG